MKNQKNITDRKQLKSFFSKGSLPNASAFEKLIDSTFNKADDKLDINEDGLMIYPSDNGKEKLFSFFEDKDDAEAKWAMFISKKDDGGIYIRKIRESDFDIATDEENEPSPAFFIQKDTENVGFGTNQPNAKLDVKGVIASKGRSGNFREGELAADGEWHNVFSTEGLNGCNAFEIMAYAEGDPGDGKYSLMHAIAISTFGNSKPKISRTTAHHGKWWNKIAIRWESKPSRIAENDEKKSMLAKLLGNITSRWEAKDTFRYNLQLKTKSNYGKKRKIVYKVSVLWNPNLNQKPTD